MSASKMNGNKRVSKRVVFGHDFGSLMIGVDGTWRVRCRVEDVSQTGARVRVFNPIHRKIREEEFFLVITADGKVKGRSKLIWTKNAAVGLAFVAEG